MNRKALAYAVAAAVPLGMTVPASHSKPVREMESSGQKYCSLVGCTSNMLLALMAPCFYNSNQILCFALAYS
jgi:hypothetical protein